MVAAPTGSGKTGVFELALARQLSLSYPELTNSGGGSATTTGEEEQNSTARNEQTAHSLLNPNARIVYIAPVKALCTER